MLSKVFATRKGRHIWVNETICEVLRQAYDKLMIHGDAELLEEMTPLLEKAYIYGVKMTKKLVENKCSLPDWEKHTDRKEVERLRRLRIHLESEMERTNEAGTDL